MMSPPGLYIYLQRRVTLTFDLLTPKVDRLILLPRGPLVPICIEIGIRFIRRYHICVFFRI